MDETLWRQRVVRRLSLRGPLTTAELIQIKPHPSRKRMRKLFREDPTFRLQARGGVSLAVAPVRTIGYSQACWDVILMQAKTAAALASWRWVWTLSQVNKGFRAALMQTDWIRSMCAFDRRPTIWKKKADDLFALKPNELDGVYFEVQFGTGFMSYKQTHLMYRTAVLELALAKHGGTFEGINAVFLLWMKRRKSRAEKRDGRGVTCSGL